MPTAMNGEIMDETPRSVPARHRARLVAALGALALAMAAASSCANPVGSATNGHACADKVAAATMGHNIGSWKCLDKALQNNLHANGRDGDTAIAGSAAFALASRYIGSDADASTYELTLTPQLAAQVNTKTVILVVWTDADGLVNNVGIPSPAF